MYIREILDDLTMNISNEFESVFIENDQTLHKLFIGDIYRIPGTNAQISSSNIRK